MVEKEQNKSNQLNAVDKLINTWCRNSKMLFKWISFQEDVIQMQIV